MCIGRTLACSWIALSMAGSALAADFHYQDPALRAEMQATDAARAVGARNSSWLQMLAWQGAGATTTAAAAGTQAAANAGQLEGNAVEGRWSDFLPLWGKELREEGYDLPLPFGVSLIGAAVWQDVFQENIRLDFGGLVIPDGIVDLSNGDSFDGSVGLRLDAFILPFFSVYVLGGYNQGNTKFTIDIANTSPILPGARLDVEEDYKGGWVGGGGTVALGWKELFWMADGNATWAKTDSAESVILAVTFSTRAGWRRQFDKLTLTGWVGTMYMDFDQTVKTSVDLLGLDIELDVANVDPWNMLLGASIDLGRNWSFVVEGGFIGRTQVVGMATFRF